jgi:hypothetical protein
MNNFLAIDLGYGSIKVAYRTSTGQLRYNKLITAIGKVEKDTVYDSQDVNLYEWNGNFYYIGSSALRLPASQLIQISDYRTFQLVSPIIISYYINMIQEKESLTFDSIVVGLIPAHASESANYLHYLEDKLSRKVEILPQGSSKFAVEKFGLDPTDDSQSTNIRIKDYIGIDLGFNTVDVFSVVDGKSSINTTKGYESLGVIKVAEELSKLVLQNYGIDLSIQDYKIILENESLYHRGKTIDLSKEIHQLVVDYLMKVIETVETDYSTAINKVDRLIMVGGGAKLISKYVGDKKLRDYLNSKYQDDFLAIPKVPEFYNVLGYFSK